MLLGGILALLLLRESREDMGGHPHENRHHVMMEA